MKTKLYDFDACNNKEEQLIQQALKNSRIETKKVVFEAPSAPTYYPTTEEFKDPLVYIRR